MNSRLLVLSHTFGYPHKVSDFLLPQPHVSKENRIMELQVENKNVISCIAEVGEETNSVAK